MKHRLLIVLVLGSCARQLAAYDYVKYLDLLQLGQEQYQDIFINGAVISAGKRECAARYEALVPILNKYKRPITVLDIGASQGYFSFRIAHEYPHAVCVMIEGNYHDKWNIADQLLDLCHENTKLDNIIFLQRRISLDDLKQLSECEHFDVVLGFNIIHHFGQEWKQITDAILSLGDNIIIETPPADDVIATSILPSLNKYLVEKKGKLIAEVPRHTSNTLGKMYWIEKKKKSLKRISWIHDIEKKKLQITSTYSKKTLYHVDKNETTTWHPGINLTTFTKLNGAFPSYQTINDTITQLSYKEHGDFTLWNLILQGKSIKMIDANDNRRQLDAHQCYQAITKLLNSLGSNYGQADSYFETYFQEIERAVLVKHSTVLDGIMRE